MVGAQRLTPHIPTLFFGRVSLLLLAVVASYCCFHYCVIAMFLLPDPIMVIYFDVLFFAELCRLLLSPLLIF